MSNESSDSKIIWNIVDDTDRGVTTDESILNGKKYIKIVMSPDKKTKILGAEPKQHEKSIVAKFKNETKDPNFMETFCDFVGGEKSSDGNIYYKIVM